MAAKNKVDGQRTKRLNAAAELVLLHSQDEWPEKTPEPETEPTPEPNPDAQIFGEIQPPETAEVQPVEKAMSPKARSRKQKPVVVNARRSGTESEKNIFSAP